MAFTYDLKTDVRYKQGIEKGIEKGIAEGKEKETRKFTEVLLLDGLYDIPKIALLVGVSEEYVLDIKAKLERKTSGLN